MSLTAAWNIRHNLVTYHCSARHYKEAAETSSCRLDTRWVCKPTGTHLLPCDLLIFFGIAPGYGFAWFGHFVFEKKYVEGTITKNFVVNNAWLTWYMLANRQPSVILFIRSFAISKCGMKSFLESATFKLFVNLGRIKYYILYLNSFDDLQIQFYNHKYLCKNWSCETLVCC